MAEVDLIEVKLEDLFLVVLGLDLTRDFRFLDFADRTFFAGDLFGEDVARQLHRDGGESLRVSVDRRAQDDGGSAVPVDAGVLVEALVLGADERVLHDFRNLVDFDERSSLETQLSDESAVNCVELRRLVRRVLAEDLDRWALAAATDESPGTIERAGTQRDEKCERKQHHSDERRVTLVEWDLVGRDWCRRRSGGGGHAECQKITVIHPR